jgi:hypothetical protein
VPIRVGRRPGTGWTRTAVQLQEMTASGCRGATPDTFSVNGASSQIESPALLVPNDPGEKSHAGRASPLVRPTGPRSARCSLSAWGHRERIRINEPSPATPSIRVSPCPQRSSRQRLASDDETDPPHVHRTGRISIGYRNPSPHELAPAGDEGPQRGICRITRRGDRPLTRDEKLPERSTRGSRRVFDG